MIAIYLAYKKKNIVSDHYFFKHELGTWCMHSSISMCLWIYISVLYHLQTTNTFFLTSGISGYMSPEYAVHGLFSTKSGVFSFGVIMLEIVSGRRNVAFSQSECTLNLLGHVSITIGQGCECILCHILISRPGL